MDWWERMRQDQILKNSLKLSAEVLDLLAEDVERYHQAGADLPEQLMRYVVDGEEEQVLGKLSNGQPLDYRFTKDHSKFILEQQVYSPQIYHRLILVYAAEPVPYQLSFTEEIDLLEKLSQFLFLFVRIGKGTTGRFQARLFEEILRGAGYPPGSLVQLILKLDPQNWHTKGLIRQGTNLVGFDELCLESPEVIIDSLRSGSAVQKVITLEVIDKLELSLDPFIDTVIPMIGVSAKSVREAAMKIIKRDPELSIPRLKQLAQSGKTEERYRSIQTLWDLERDKVRGFLEEHQQKEKSEKIQVLINHLLTTQTDHHQQKDLLSLPPLQPVELDAPLTLSLQETLRNFVDQCNLVIDKKREELIHKLIERRHQLSTFTHTQLNWLSIFPDGAQLIDFVSAPLQYSDEEMRQELRNRMQKQLVYDVIARQMENGSKKECDEDAHWTSFIRTNELYQQLFPILKHPDLQLIQMIRFVRMFHEYLSHDLTESFEVLYYLQQHHPIGLRELAEASKAFGIRSNELASSLMNWNSFAKSNLYRTLSKDQIWPYFAENIHRIEEQLDTDNRLYALELLTCFPSPPSSLVARLWDSALGSAKRERSLAQTCLDPLVDTEGRLIMTLQDNRGEIRGIAAEWLANRGSPRAVEPIRAALKKEKSEVAKDSMLRSLERLGASVEEFLDRSVLLKEAQQGLKKGISTPLRDWFPFSTIPTVHWVDTKEIVDPEILTWFILQGYKRKVIEPGPILRRYVSQFDPEERQALGQFILDSWITQDTLPVKTPEEAEELAKREADREQRSVQKETNDLQKMIAQYQANPKDPSANLGMEFCQERLQQLQKFSWDKSFRSKLEQYMSECKQSATKEKGILSVAAACCGSEAVFVIDRYIKKWYGMRAAQCKALLQVLAWIDDNNAIQLLLSIANRFRTKSIQKEAEAQVDQLAKRQSWTREELADRTIPTAGFDQNGVMILDYGERQFQATLDPKFNVILTDTKGKQIKSLPEARKDEDADHVKTLKKQLSNAKKQIKQTLKQQTERFYEAMCTQRCWIFEDWQQILYNHPIVGQLSQRLIWAVVQEDRVIQTFRPLEDGTLTDTEDDQVSVDPKAIIQLAHACILSPDQIQSWREHLSDYEIEPVFEQFLTEIYLHQGNATETEIRTYEGYLLEAFQLRGVLTKRGYNRETTEDGGWFYGYRKTFSGLDLAAIIEFSGNYLPEDNNMVALIKLEFQRSRVGEDIYNFGFESQMPLDQIPKILLSEAWNDMRIAASQGTGYDPDWELKV